MRAFKKNGSIRSAVLYRGPSAIDGRPIVMIGTVGSSNSKTGAMLQTWILRADIDPITANRTGEDFSICGNCPLRGQANPGKDKGLAEKRGCYVQIGQAPAAIYKRFSKSNGYSTVPESMLADYGAGQVIRCGAYGDPMAVPQSVWDSLLARADSWTGYTHQAQELFAGRARSRVFGRFCMVSADNLAQARKAWADGFRTFRIVSNVSEIRKGREILCPATPEGGRKTTCENCTLCAGAAIAAKSIAVVVHGAGKKHAGAIIAKAA